VSIKKTEQKVRTPTQLAMVELRETANLSQQGLAVIMERNTATVGRWETSRPPTGLALVELAQLALRFGRMDLCETFTNSVDSPLLHGDAHLKAGVKRMDLASPLPAAVRNIYTWSGLRQGPPSRRAYWKILDAITTAHAAFLEDEKKSAAPLLDLAESEQIQNALERIRKEEKKEKDSYAR
jgi:transcriptional regulator with XRE-family HTH domain